MTGSHSTDMVRSVTGKKPTSTQALEGRAAARANRGPTHGQIELRAFQIYEAGGRVAGSDVRDWLQAERELRRYG